MNVAKLKTLFRRAEPTVPKSGLSSLPDGLPKKVKITSAKKGLARLLRRHLNDLLNKDTAIQHTAVSQLLEDLAEAKQAATGELAANLVATNLSTLDKEIREKGKLISQAKMTKALCQDLDLDMRKQSLPTTTDQRIPFLRSLINATDCFVDACGFGLIINKDAPRAIKGTRMILLCKRATRNWCFFPDAYRNDEFYGTIITGKVALTVSAWNSIWHPTSALRRPAGAPTAYVPPGSYKEYIDSVVGTAERNQHDAELFRLTAGPQLWILCGIPFTDALIRVVADHNTAAQKQESRAQQRPAPPPYVQATTVRQRIEVLLEGASGLERGGGASAAAAAPEITLARKSGKRGQILKSQILDHEALIREATNRQRDSLAEWNKSFVLVTPEGAGTTLKRDGLAKIKELRQQDLEASEQVRAAAAAKRQGIPGASKQLEDARGMASRLRGAPTREELHQHRVNDIQMAAMSCVKQKPDSLYFQLLQFEWQNTHYSEPSTLDWTQQLLSSNYNADVLLSTPIAPEHYRELIRSPATAQALRNLTRNWPPVPSDEAKAAIFGLIDRGADIQVLTSSSPEGQQPPPRTTFNRNMLGWSLYESWLTATDVNSKTDRLLDSFNASMVDFGNASPTITDTKEYTDGSNITTASFIVSFTHAMHESYNKLRAHEPLCMKTPLAECVQITTALNGFRVTPKDKTFRQAVICNRALVRHTSDTSVHFIEVQMRLDYNKLSERRLAVSSSDEDDEASPQIPQPKPKYKLHLRHNQLKLATAEFEPPEPFSWPDDYNTRDKHPPFINYELRKCRGAFVQMQTQAYTAEKIRYNVNCRMAETFARVIVNEQGWNKIKNESLGLLNAIYRLELNQLLYELDTEELHGSTLCRKMDRLNVAEPYHSTIKDRLLREFYETYTLRHHQGSDVAFDNNDFIEHINRQIPIPTSDSMNGQSWEACKVFFNTIAGNVHEFMMQTPGYSSLCTADDFIAHVNKIAGVRRGERFFVSQEMFLRLNNLVACDYFMAVLKAIFEHYIDFLTRKHSNIEEEAADLNVPMLCVQQAMERAKSLSLQPSIEEETQAALRAKSITTVPSNTYLRDNQIHYSLVEFCLGQLLELDKPNSTGCTVQIQTTNGVCKVELKDVDKDAVLRELSAVVNKYKPNNPFNFSTNTFNGRLSFGIAYFAGQKRETESLQSRSGETWPFIIRPENVKIEDVPINALVLTPPGRGLRAGGPGKITNIAGAPTRKIKYYDGSTERQTDIVLTLSELVLWYIQTDVTLWGKFYADGIYVVSILDSARNWLQVEMYGEDGQHVKTVQAYAKRNILDCLKNAAEEFGRTSNNSWKKLLDGAEDMRVREAFFEQYFIFRTRKNIMRPTGDYTVQQGTALYKQLLRFTPPKLLPNQTPPPEPTDDDLLSLRGGERAASRMGRSASPREVDDMRNVSTPQHPVARPEDTMPADSLDVSSGARRTRSTPPSSPAAAAAEEGQPAAAGLDAGAEDYSAARPHSPASYTLAEYLVALNATPIETLKSERIGQRLQRVLELCEKVNEGRIDEQTANAARDISITLSTLIAGGHDPDGSITKLRTICNVITHNRPWEEAKRKIAEASAPARPLSPAAAPAPKPTAGGSQPRPATLASASSSPESNGSSDSESDSSVDESAESGLKIGKDAPNRAQPPYVGPLPQAPPTPPHQGVITVQGGDPLTAITARSSSPTPSLELATPASTPAASANPPDAAAYLQNVKTELPTLLNTEALNEAYLTETLRRVTEALLKTEGNIDPQTAAAANGIAVYLSQEVVNFPAQQVIIQELANAMNLIQEGSDNATATRQILELLAKFVKGSNATAPPSALLRGTRARTGGSAKKGGSPASARSPSPSRAAAGSTPEGSPTRRQIDFKQYATSPGAPSSAQKLVRKYESVGDKTSALVDDVLDCVLLGTQLKTDIPKLVLKDLIDKRKAFSDMFGHRWAMLNKLVTDVNPLLLADQLSGYIQKGDAEKRPSQATLKEVGRKRIIPVEDNLERIRRTILVMIDGFNRQMGRGVEVTEKDEDDMKQVIAYSKQSKSGEKGTQEVAISSANALIRTLFSLTKVSYIDLNQEIYTTACAFIEVNINKNSTLAKRKSAFDKHVAAIKQGYELTLLSKEKERGQIQTLQAEKRQREQALDEAQHRVRELEAEDETRTKEHTRVVDLLDTIRASRIADVSAVEGKRNEAEAELAAAKEELERQKADHKKTQKLAQDTIEELTTNYRASEAQLTKITREKEAASSQLRDAEAAKDALDRQLQDASDQQEHLEGELAQAERSGRSVVQPQDPVLQAADLAILQEIRQAIATSEGELKALRKTSTELLTRSDPEHRAILTQSGTNTAIADAISKEVRQNTALLNELRANVEKLSQQSGAPATEEVRAISQRLEQIQQSLQALQGQPALQPPGYGKPLLTDDEQATLGRVAAGLPLQSNEDTIAAELRRQRPPLSSSTPAATAEVAGAAPVSPRGGISPAKSRPAGASPAASPRSGLINRVLNAFDSVSGPLLGRTRSGSSSSDSSSDSGGGRRDVDLKPAIYAAEAFVGEGNPPHYQAAAAMMLALSPGQTYVIRAQDADLWPLFLSRIPKEDWQNAYDQLGRHGFTRDHTYDSAYERTVRAWARA